MPNLICFPHYTCGGLLCDILSDTFSPLAANGGINSIHHGVGKIGDANTVLTEYDPQQFMDRVSTMTLPANSWIGTHCWPGLLPLDQFDKVIVITTTTFKSKIYRWARAYHHYFAPQWQELTGMDLVDKARETAKNYLVPFEPIFLKENVVNVEFADVVETTQEFYHAVNNQDCEMHMDRWKTVNDFLYADKFWNSKIVQYFYQAEFETNLGRYYRYN
jgi:hypothetical protein